VGKTVPTPAEYFTGSFPVIACKFVEAVTSRSWIVGELDGIGWPFYELSN